MKLAVIFPTQNREVYKTFQKSYLPAYLNKQGITAKVFFAEQQDNLLFSRSRAVNAGVLYALETYSPDYLVISDVDLVPLNVPYTYNKSAEVWFCNAGGLKILTKDFILINGYNNSFRGWGYEDSELWHRLDTFGVPNVDWKFEAPKGTEMVDLEMINRDSRAHTTGYFNGLTNLRFYHPSEVAVTSGVNTIYEKNWLDPNTQQNNAALCDAIKSLPRLDALPYFMRHGLNQINTRNITVVSDTDTSAEISFNSLTIL